jgi:hypothetical protein
VVYYDFKENPILYTPKTITLHEKPDIRVKVIEFKKQCKFGIRLKAGNFDTYTLYLAKWAEKRFSAETLVNNGCNLSY